MQTPLLKVPSVSSHVVIHSEHLPAEWDAYLEKFPEATWYQGSRWKKLVEQVFGHHSCYLSLSRNGVIAGVLPLTLIRNPLFGAMLVSVPYGSYGGVCADDDDAVATLISEAKRLAHDQKTRYLEIRSLKPLPDEQFRTKTFKRTFPALLPENEKSLWDYLSTEMRTKIRKAEKNGCRGQIGGVELLEEFYFVFSRRMRDLGTPVYPRKFFAMLCSLYPEIIRFILIKKEGRVIGAGMWVIDRKKAEVPWSASLTRHLKDLPNYLLFWTAMKESVRQGCLLFDFGTSAEGSGPAHFKEQWGAKEVLLHWQYYVLKGIELPDLSPHNPRFRFLIRLWQWLPLSIANRLGPLLSHGIP